jgi:hypothetical protein
VERLIIEGGVGMTKHEVIKLLVLIETVYSHCMTKNETVAYWFDFCSKMNKENVMMKLNEHIRKSPYPPTIANLTVFTNEVNEFPEKVESWIKQGRERREQDSKSVNQRPKLAWMEEYSLRKSARG